ncbi:MAG TPA: cupin domain-containing protein [Gaiellaceae bacterium]|nr:cupin domain-containing protein [Gaiellaceae bacterium]HVV56860.1 cupin domain-containing protein [Gaiellaceae bacterium]
MQHWDLLSLDAPEGTRDPTVLHSDDGSRAVLVALGAGQELGDHQVKENAWVTVVQGTVQVTAGGETVEGRVGSTFHFEPDERHSLRSEGGARILLLLAPWPGEGHYRGGR